MTYDNERKRDFVEHYLLTNNGAEAARKAGYSTSKAKHTAWRLLRTDPLVMGLLAERRQQLMKATEMTTERLQDQLMKDRDFAIKTENATAAVRASELIGKLHGKFIERHEHAAVGGFKIEISVPKPGGTIDG